MDVAKKNYFGGRLGPGGLRLAALLKKPATPANARAIGWQGFRVARGSRENLRLNDGSVEALRMP